MCFSNPKNVLFCKIVEVVYMVSYEGQWIFKEDQRILVKHKYWWWRIGWNFELSYENQLKVYSCLHIYECWKLS